MSHEITDIDCVGLKGEQAWHGLGVVVDDNLTAEQAGERFNLFWGVDGWTLEAIGPQGQRLAVPTHVANVRTADANGQAIEHLLGVVGADYQVCQNRELAQFTDALAQTGQVTIESCGSIRGGKRVWFLARGESFDIGGKDKVWPYILVSNGHDGTQAIRVTPTTVRVVCSNTLHMVIPASDDSTQFDSAAISIRHQGKIADKLEQAKNALAYYRTTLARNLEMYEAMQSKQIDRAQALKLFAATYATFWEAATEDDLTSTDDETRRVAAHRMRRMQEAGKAFLKRFQDEDEKTGLGETQWSYFNALTGFIQHDKKGRGKDDGERVARRMESNLFGINADRTQKVLEAALAI